MSDIAKVHDIQWYSEVPRSIWKQTLIGLLLMALFLGHIYLGTIGMRGAYRAMRTGYVSEGWAKEHHELWYDDIKAGKIPAQRSGKPAPAKPMPQTREA